MHVVKMMLGEQIMPTLMLKLLSDFNRETKRVKYIFEFI